MAERSVKILIVGDCEGNFKTLFKRVAAANKKSGPFDALFCVGAFFASATASGENASLTDLEAYLQGQLQPPIPTYFIGVGHQNEEDLIAVQAHLQSDATSGHKINYLGKAGVATIQGLTVAFLDGVSGGASSCRRYTREDVQSLKSAVDSLEGDVDLLLTCEWPRGITTKLPPSSLPEALQVSPSAAELGSAPTADVASWVRPRYHCAGGQQDCFFARPPYLNKDLGAGGRATRFVALASVTNTTKQKSLHALALLPASALSPEQLQQKPDGCTPSPYEAAGGKRPFGLMDAANDEGGAQDWRWQMAGGKRARADGATPWGKSDVVKDQRKTVFVRNLPYAVEYADLEVFFSAVGKVVDIRRPLNDRGQLQGWAHVQLESVDSVPAALQLSGSELMGRELFIDAAVHGGAAQANIGKPVEDCWFCLSSASADTSLVVSIGEEGYIAVDKGAVSGEHVLLVPIEHYPSLVSLTADCYSEMMRYLSALRACFAAGGKELVAFERHLTLRNRGGNHCHFNVVAVPPAAGKRAGAEFQRAAKEAGFDMTSLPAAAGGGHQGGQDALRDVVGDGEYFLAVLPDGSQLVQPIRRGERWPMNLGREVLASLVGAPQKADWKACSYGEKELGDMVVKFKAAFDAYDIMQS